MSLMIRKHIKESILKSNTKFKYILFICGKKNFERFFQILLFIIFNLFITQ